MKLKVLLTNRDAYISFRDSAYDLLEDYFSYSFPNAKFTPAYRYRGWDGRIRLLKKNGTLPAGLFRALRDKIIEETRIKFSVETDIESIFFNKKEVLSDREYQNECIEKMVEASNYGGGLITSCTGSGKTLISGIFLSRLDGNAIFVVDELTLLHQAKKELQNVLKENVGEVGNSIFNPQRITVATSQTLYRHRNKSEFRKWIKNISVVFIDEIHQAMNRRTFKSVESINAPCNFGLTATLELKKKDVRLRAYSICGPKIYEFPIKEAQEGGYVTSGIVCQVQHQHYIFEKKGIKAYSEEYDEAIVECVERNKIITSLAMEAINRKKYVIILVERIEHIRLISKQISLKKYQASESFMSVREHGLSMLQHSSAKSLSQANVTRNSSTLKKHSSRNLPNFEFRAVFGEISAENRVQTQSDMESGKVQLIIANKVFKKGVNIKKADVIIDAAGMKSSNDAIQKFGRGVRLCDGKLGLLYFDIGDLDNRFEAAAKKRRRAFKSESIPVFKISGQKPASEIFEFAERKLMSELEKKS